MDDIRNYLHVLAYAMQCRTFKAAQTYKVMNMAHNVLSVLLTVTSNSPQFVGYHIEQSSTAEGGDLLARCGYVGKTATGCKLVVLWGVRVDAMVWLKISPFTALVSLSMSSFVAAIKRLPKDVSAAAILL